jgi:aspartate aminotransferase
LPYWVSYIEIVKLSEGKVVTPRTTLESDYKITPSQLEAAITPKTKMFIFLFALQSNGSVLHT